MISMWSEIIEIFMIYFWRKTTVTLVHKNILEWTFTFSNFIDVIAFILRINNSYIFECDQNGMTVWFSLLVIAYLSFKPYLSNGLLLNGYTQPALLLSIQLGIFEFIRSRKFH